MLERMLLRTRPRFIWIYFNWGQFCRDKRIVLEVFIQVKRHIRGFTVGWSNEEGLMLKL